MCEECGSRAKTEQVEARRVEGGEHNPHKIIGWKKKKKKKKQPIWMFTDYGNKSTHHCLAVRQLLFSAEAAAKGRKSHWTQPAQHGRAGRQTQPQAGEHNGAFSSLWCSYVPQDLLKTLNSAKREWKHDSKWMITLPCNCCEQGFLKI